MHDILYGRSITETEAWLLVKDSLSEAQQEPEWLGGAKRAWSKLPEDVRKLVSPRQLLEWNSVDPDKLDTVIQSNFMRSYRDVRDRRYEKEAMSASLSKTIKALQKASPVYKDPDALPESKAELPEPKKLAYEKPEWMIRRGL